jgi:large subunit ribosomal protein L7e
LLAKKRKRDEQWAAQKAASAVEAKKKARTTRSSIFKKAEGYVKEYRSQVVIG